ncbi:MAG: hypothetical protein ABW168_03760 [Sedimenticola sp.]
MEFEEKFVAFIDILGFKGLVELAESGESISLSELMENLSKLGDKKDEEKFAKYGGTTCPQSKYISKDLNFRITQISDCVIVSSEVSPAGIINLISHCWGAVIELLMKGIMCRGYITKGLIYHKDNQVIGSGYQKAYLNESGVTAFKMEANERGTPFVEIDPTILNYVQSSTDRCINEMFSRMVKTESDASALFPFQRLSHSFVIAGFGHDLDPEKEKESNNNMRKLLTTLKERVMSFVDPSNEKAMSKAKHYLRALEDQLVVCNKTEEVIDKLCTPAHGSLRQ